MTTKPESTSSDSISDRRIDMINATRYISPEILAIEAELINLKYVDYAFLSAVEATRLFQRQFIEMYQEYHGRYLDYHERENKRGMKSVSLFENPAETITALWKGRQTADALGMEYGLYCRTAFRHLVDRGYRHLPLPNQLYSDSVVEATQELWAYESTTTDKMFMHTRDSRFKTENYCGEPAQDRYIQLQLDAVSARLECNRPNLLAILCFDTQTLHPDVIVEHFGLNFDDIKKLWSGNEGEFSSDIDETDFRRPCFGLPHVEPESPHRCELCPTLELCHSERTAVSENLTRRFGSDDLKGEHKRKMAAARKRRQRARDKEKRLVLPVN